jgi:putative flippase GtrA
MQTSPASAIELQDCHVRPIGTSTPKPPIWEPRNHTSRPMIFAGVAAVGFVLQLAALAVLSGAAHLPTAIATALAVEIAVLNNFGWHERWTWRDRVCDDRKGRVHRLMRFHAGAGLISLVGNVGITATLVDVLHAPVMLANSAAVILLGVANFFVTDRIVFRPSRRAPHLDGSHGANQGWRARSARSRDYSRTNCGSPGRSATKSGATPKSASM